MSDQFNWSPSVLVAAVAAATLTLSTPANAQLEEVIVTAQKKAESVQDVPIAVTAFDEEAMRLKQINSFADMRFAAPNVTYSKVNFTGNNFQIRGIGTSLVAASGDNGVGIHVNEVPLNSPRLFETEYFDVSQVAVLRGPQGTLYGRNSTGGAVNMETRKASTEGFEGSLEAQYGNYDHKKLNGAINIPLGDTLAVRFAGLWLERDGYTDNLYTGNDVDGRDQYSYRASLRWEPSENTTVDLMYSYFEEDSNRTRSQKTMCEWDPTGLLGCSPDKLGFDQPNSDASLQNLLVSTAVLGPLGVYDIGSGVRQTTPRDLRKVYSEFDPIYKSDEELITLTINHEMDDYTLSFVAGYQDTMVDSLMDYTWNVNPVLSPSPILPFVMPNTYAARFADGLFPVSAPSNNATGVVGGHIQGYYSGLEVYDRSNEDAEQYSFEARIQSNYDGPFNFLLGAFYMDVELDNQFWVFGAGLDYFSLIYPAAVSNFALDGFGWAAPNFNNSTDFYGIESTAFFGEIYYDVTDSVKLTVGLRYTEDYKEIQDRQFLFDIQADGTPAFQPLGADLPINDPPRDTDDEWQEYTGRVVVDWTVNDDTLVYASYSRGYKGGGFNPPFDPTLFPDTASTFEPEFVDAFEIGTKNTLFDSTLQANFSAFMYDYKDLQVSKIINRTSFNENTDAKIWGAEAELVFAPDEHWQLYGNIAYLNTEIEGLTSLDTRDPTEGNPNVTLIKDVSNASNCVVDMQPEIFRAVVGSQFSSCAALTAAGLPVSGGIEADLDGNQLSNSPEWSFSGGVQYTFDLAQDYALALRLDYYWQDEMYGRNFNKPIDKIDAWDIWNAQANLYSADEKWYVRAFVKNIEDDDNIVGMYVTDPSSAMFTNVFTIEPRTYGVAVGYNF